MVLSGDRIKPKLLLILEHLLNVRESYTSRYVYKSRASVESGEIGTIQSSCPSFLVVVSVVVVVTSSEVLG